MFQRRFSLSNLTWLDRQPASAIEACIDEYVHNEQYRAILKRRLLDGVKYEALAEEFDLSVRHVKDIVKAYRDIIDDRLITE